jgi:hypothetical protein
MRTAVNAQEQNMAIFLDFLRVLLFGWQPQMTTLSHSHGGNTGSNPVGDANDLNKLDGTGSAEMPPYGKYTAKVLPDAGG